MPRQLRIEYPGAMYHVMSRGNRRQDIYLDDVDRHDFLKTLAEACQKTDWQVHAYCPGYYLAAPEHRPHWIRVDRLLGEHGLPGDTGAARQEFERRMEARRLEPGDEEGLKALRRGRCVGTERFRRQQLEALDGKVGEHHFGQLRLETAQAKAERIIAEELARLGWQEGDLAARRKQHPDKVQLAQRLRKETTLSVRQIAERLYLGTSKSVSFRLLTKRKPVSCSPPSQFRLGL